MSNKPKYFGVYSGPSYFSYDSEYVMGFASLAQARHAFRSFYNGSVWYDEYRENADGLYVPWSIGRYSLTPGTSCEDLMYLYSAHEDPTPGTYFKSEEVNRVMTFGARGGIVVEK